MPMDRVKGPTEQAHHTDNHRNPSISKVYPDMRMVCEFA